MNLGEPEETKALLSAMRRIKARAQSRQQAPPLRMIRIEGRKSADGAPVVYTADCRNANGLISSWPMTKDITC